MGRPRTCFCDACPKCLRRAAYHRRKGQVVDLRPRPAPVDDAEPVRVTAAGRVPLTAEQRAELRRRIDDATRRQIAAARDLPIEGEHVAIRRPRERRAKALAAVTRK